jgi:hypothetical protein
MTGGFNFIPCHPTSNFTNYQDFHPSDNFFLIWMQEYLNRFSALASLFNSPSLSLPHSLLIRLERGIYRYQPLDLTDPAVQLQPNQMHERYSIKMISLVPLLPLYNPLPSRAFDLPDNILNSRRNFGATKQISKGVEAVTCPVFIPEMLSLRERSSSL